MSPGLIKYNYNNSYQVDYNIILNSYIIIHIRHTSFHFEYFKDKGTFVFFLLSYCNYDRLPLFEFKILAKLILKLACYRMTLSYPRPSVNLRLL